MNQSLLIILLGEIVFRCIVVQAQSPAFTSVEQGVEYSLLQFGTDPHQAAILKLSAEKCAQLVELRKRHEVKLESVTAADLRRARAAVEPSHPHSPNAEILLSAELREPLRQILPVDVLKTIARRYTNSRLSAGGLQLLLTSEEMKVFLDLTHEKSGLLADACLQSDAQRNEHLQTATRESIIAIGRESLPGEKRKKLETLFQPGTVAKSDYYPATTLVGDGDASYLLDMAIQPKNAKAFSIPEEAIRVATEAIRQSDEEFLRRNHNMVTNKSLSDSEKIAEAKDAYITCDKQLRLVLEELITPQQLESIAQDYLLLIVQLGGVRKFFEDQRTVKYLDMKSAEHRNLLLHATNHESQLRTEAEALQYKQLNEIIAKHLSPHQQQLLRSIGLD